MLQLVGLLRKQRSNRYFIAKPGPVHCQFSCAAHVRVMALPENTFFGFSFKFRKLFCFAYKKISLYGAYHEQKLFELIFFHFAG
jgi:hypothetical protein